MSTTPIQTSNPNGAIDQGTRQALLDLATSDREVLEIVQKRFGREDLSFAQQQELQYLFSARQQKSSLLSNMLRSIADTLSNIIRNFRP